MKHKYFLFSIIFILSINCVNAAEVTTFVSPDCSFGSFEDFISGTTTSLYIAVYEFTNPCLLDLLNEENISDLVLLVDDSPVGGLKLEERKTLCELEENNASVFLYKGPGFHHAKYIIRDNSSVLITSENFGYTGFPKNKNYGNRGWGSIVEDKQLTGDFMQIFFADLKNAEKFKCKLKNYETNCNPKEGNYTPEFKPEKFHNQSVYTIFAPGAIKDVLNLIDSANKSIYIQQMYIYKYWGPRKTGSVEKTPNLFLESVINKSREGVDVKILLDSYWYNVDKSNPVSNYYTVKYINQVAKKENLTLEAKLVDLNKHGFEKIHNKGMIIDNKTVLVSSINWNEHSPKENREAGVVITGEVAKYYADVFFYDWNGINKKIHDNKTKKSEENRKIKEYTLIGLLGGALLIIFLIYFRYKRK